jgi:hypothetical protein
MIVRAFNHGSMKSASKLFAAPTWKDASRSILVLPTELRRVADLFAELQELRHEADYDTYRTYTVLEAESIWKLSREAFDHWQTIRTHTLAGSYLLAMLLGRPR